MHTLKYQKKKNNKTNKNPAATIRFIFYSIKYRNKYVCNGSPSSFYEFISLISMANTNHKHRFQCVFVWSREKELFYFFLVSNVSFVCSLSNCLFLHAIDTFYVLSTVIVGKSGLLLANCNCVPKAIRLNSELNIEQTEKKYQN